MTTILSETSQMEWTAEHTDLLPMSHAKTQRRKGRRQLSFSSQPKAYQDSIPLTHAKTQREWMGVTVGYV